MDPNFWGNMEEAQKILQEIKALKVKIEQYNELYQEYEDIVTLVEMGLEEQEESLIPEAKQGTKAFISHYEDMRILLYSMVNMTKIMPYSLSTREPEEQKPVIGYPCCLECISGGQRIKSTR